MGRTAKIFGISIAAVMVLALAGLVAVVVLVDPNDYKGDITAAVQRATGRELTLEGDLELAVFPTIRIAVGPATLSNAEGFGPEPWARIAGAELSVRLLPLLSKRVEVREAALTGLELNLGRDARGRNNWQDLDRGSERVDAPALPPGDEGRAANFDLRIEAIEIEDSRVIWNDAATGSRWELTDFDLQAADLGPGHPFPLETQFRLAGDDVMFKVDARANATLALAANEYRLEALEVTLDGSGNAWPGTASQAKLKFDSLVANLGDETLELDGLTVDFLGLTMAGSLSGRQLLSNFALSGAIDIRDFAPRALLERFGVNAQTADSAVLTHAAARADLVYRDGEMGLRDLQLTLDDSKLTGRVALEGERLTYDLAVDAINVDRYLPPAEGGASDEEGSLDGLDLPLEVLRTLDARGELKLGHAQFSGLTLANAAFVINAANGAVRLMPSAELYGGRTAGEIRIQTEGDAARLSFQQSLQGVDVAALGQALLGASDITGTGDVRLNLVAAGSNLGQMRRELDGDVAFTITNGSIEGVDLWYELRRARALVDRAAVPDRGDAPRRTLFSSLSATGLVQDALLTNRDLKGELDFMALAGAGTVNLLNDNVDFDLMATLVDGPALQSDPELAKMAGSRLPLRVTGTLDAPSITPDFGAIVRARVSEEVNEAVEERRDELNDAVEQKRDEAREEVRDRLRDRLRGVLER